MKTETLQQAGLTAEQIALVMKENGLDIAAEQVKTAAAEGKALALTTERDTYKQQAEDAQKEICGYKDMDIDGIKQKAADWEAKYNADMAELKKQLAEQAYAAELDKFVAGYQFTNNLVKKAVITELKAKEFKLENGTLLGAKEYMEQLKADNPTAFGDARKIPTITLPGADTPPASLTKEDFKKMTYMEQVKIFHENPELYRQLTN